MISLTMEEKVLLRFWMATFVFFIMANVSAATFKEKYSGEGECYLSRALEGNGGCSYHVIFDQSEEMLDLIFFVVWHEQWGDFYESWRRRYYIKNESELWMKNHIGREIQVGELQANKVLIDYTFPGGRLIEQMSFDHKGMAYFGNQESTGKRWLYEVEMTTLGK